MNAADLVILAVLALSTLVGLWRGFVSEAWSLVSWIAAFWVAWRFGYQAAQLYGHWLDEPAARMLAGYITCFLGVLIVGAILGWALRRLMNRSGLRGDDRLLGTFFGLARGLLLVTIVVLVMGFTPVPRDASWWRQARLLPWFENGAAWLAARLPAGVSEALDRGSEFLPVRPGQPLPALRSAPAAPASARSSGAGRTGIQAQMRADVGQ